MFRPDPNEVALAVEALSYVQCPAYKGEGVCQQGCRSEPYCQTGEPPEGWVGYALDRLTGDESPAPDLESTTDGGEHV